MSHGTTPAEAVVIALNAISDIDRFQPRVNGLDNRHTRVLAEVGPENLPPPVITPNGDGTYDIVSGNHTIAAARLNGFRELRCVVSESAGYEEAFASNLRHGLPPSMDDRKEYARWLAEYKPGLSFREIGRLSGLSDKTAKRAIEDKPAESPKMRSAPDPLDRWFTQTYNLDRTPSVRDVRRDIDAYDDSERLNVAKVYAAIGKALVESSAPYLSGSSR